MSITELKKKSLEQLKGNWGKAAGVSAIYLFVTVLLQEILKNNNIFSSLFQSIVIVFFSLGIISFLFNITKNKAQVNDIFSQSNTWLKGIGISLIQSSPILIMTFLSTIVFVTHNGDNSNLLLTSVYGISCLLLLIAAIIINLMFALSSTILVDNPEINVTGALKKSRELMKGQKIKFILLCLSFLGWIILATLTFGIGFLWLVPYMQLSIVNFYIDLRDKKI